MLPAGESGTAPVDPLLSPDHCPIWSKYWSFSESGPVSVAGVTFSLFAGSSGDGERLGRGAASGDDAGDGVSRA